MKFLLKKKWEILAVVIVGVALLAYPKYSVQQSGDVNKVVAIVSDSYASCMQFPDNLTPDEQKMQVKLRMNFRKDGTVIDAKIMDETRYEEDPAFKRIADFVLGYALDCGKDPLDGMPEDIYDRWKTLELLFDPRIEKKKEVTKE